VQPQIGQVGVVRSGTEVFEYLGAKAALIVEPKFGLFTAEDRGISLY